jgi:hypothetical protein
MNDRGCLAQSRKPIARCCAQRRVGLAYGAAAIEAAEKAHKKVRKGGMA